MKKIIAMLLTLALCLSFAACTAGGGDKADFTVGVCQLMVHDSLDAATEGFKEALTEELQKAGKTVTVDVQVAGEANLCGTVVKTFVSKQADLIMANATPALLAAANATTTIPVLGTSVTDYADTFAGSIPSNVSGTSDAVPFDEQAQMMIDTLKLVAGDKVGVLYCIDESNSKLQYEAVKALFEEKGIVVEAYTFSEVTELQALVSSMADACKAVYVPSDNTVANNDSIVGTICTEKNVPVYTSYGGAICYASLAINYKELGRQTGKMAAQVLLGEKTVADLEIMTLTPAVSYNADLCGKLGITVPQN